MPRTHAELRIDIWNDDDFRRLTIHAQLLYLQLISSSSLSYAGVADWRAARIAALSADADRTNVELAADELVAEHFIVVDRDTEEVLVRSFFKHDGLLNRPNVTKAMIREFADVASPMLRGVIVHQLNKLRGQFPTWKGWGVEEIGRILSREAIDPFGMPVFHPVRNPSENPSENPSGNPSGNPFPNPSAKGSQVDPPLPTPFSLLPAPSSPLPPDRGTHRDDDEHLAQSRFDDAFTEAWAAWPKHENEIGARAAFAGAANRIGLDGIRDAVIRFGDAYRVAEPEPRFIPNLSRWLNDQRWTDDLPTPVVRHAGRPNAAEQRMSDADRVIAELSGLADEYATPIPKEINS